MKLINRTVLITGASQGIGAATARAFAAHPVRLALLARSEDALAALAAELNQRPGVQALPLVADVGRAEEVQRAIARVQAELGPVDILVNNAGIGMPSPVGAIDRASAEAVFAVNFWGALSCIESVLPAMKARRDGLIINISSIMGHRAMPGAGIYCASKFALNALSEALRLEARPYGVRVVSFYPGVTDTNIVRSEDARYNRNRVRKTPADVVGRAIVRAAEREPRDAYATRFDRIFVGMSLAAPGLMDWMLTRFYRAPGV